MSTSRSRGTRLRDSMALDLTTYSALNTPIVLDGGGFRANEHGASRHAG